MRRRVPKRYAFGSSSRADCGAICVLPTQTTSEQVLLVPIFFAKKSVTRATVPPFRKKARSENRHACKRARCDFRSLPPFCEESFWTRYFLFPEGRLERTGMSLIRFKFSQTKKGPTTGWHVIGYNCRSSQPHMVLLNKITYSNGKVNIISLYTIFYTTFPLAIKFLLCYNVALVKRS